MIRGISLVLFGFFVGSFSACFLNAPKITKDELKLIIDEPDVVIIDVRSDKDWNSSDTKIKGAVREDYKNIDSWINKYSKDKKLIFYCL